MRAGHHFQATVIGKIVCAITSWSHYSMLLLCCAAYSYMDMHNKIAMFYVMVCSIDKIMMKIMIGYDL